MTADATGMHPVTIRPETASDVDGIIGHALLTRCHIGSTPALCLAPCSRLTPGTPVPSGRVRYAAAFGI